MKFVSALAAAMLVAAAPAMAARLKVCGDLSDPAPPSDYRKGQTEFAGRLSAIEHASFTADVASGAAGPQGASALDVTLQSFPNHAPALTALTRLALKEKRAKLPGMKYPVECYFDRAQRLAPDDPAVYTAYASYLYGLGLNDKAVEMYLRAMDFDKRNAVICYNLALAYFKLSNFALANKYAQRAYNAGFPLPGLRTMLQNAGKWELLPDEKMPPPSEAGDAENTESAPATPEAQDAPAPPVPVKE